MYFNTTDNTYLIFMLNFLYQMQQNQCILSIFKTKFFEYASLN